MTESAFELSFESKRTNHICEHSSAISNLEHTELIADFCLKSTAPSVSTHSLFTHTHTCRHTPALELCLRIWVINLITDQSCCSDLFAAHTAGRLTSANAEKRLPVCYLLLSTHMHHQLSANWKWQPAVSVCVLYNFFPTALLYVIINICDFGINASKKKMKDNLEQRIKGQKVPF